MIVYEFKAQGNTTQYQKIDEAIKITKFLRNKCLRFWLDNQGVKYYDLNKYTAVLAKEFDFADKLNSMARQAAAERTAFAIKRFFENCKSKKPGKKTVALWNTKHQGGNFLEIGNTLLSLINVV
jgi:putative transposase